MKVAEVAPEPRSDDGEAAVEDDPKPKGKPGRKPKSTETTPAESAAGAAEGMLPPLSSAVIALCTC